MNSPTTPADNVMSPEEIVSALRYDGDQVSLPFEALRAAREQRRFVGPLLLAELERASGELQTVLEAPDAYIDISYALYLLAEFRESGALAPLLRILALPEADLDLLLGDILIHDGPMLIASVCGGEVTAIHGLIENPRASAYARDAALRALLLLVADGTLHRDNMIAYLRHVCSTYPAQDQQLWSLWTQTAASIYPQELMPEIRAAFQAGRIAGQLITLDKIESDLREGRDAVLARLRAQPRYVANAIDCLAYWIERTDDDEEEFDTDEDEEEVVAEAVSGNPPGLPYRRDVPKVGRNDPCPCGSGKKYKKCCLTLE